MSLAHYLVNFYTTGYTGKAVERLPALLETAFAVSHEGGYNPQYVPYCGLAVLETLSGVDTGFPDPLAPVVAGWISEPLLDPQKAVVDEAARLVANIRR